jgi:hypothetical protein
MARCSAASRRGSSTRLVGSGAGSSPPRLAGPLPPLPANEGVVGLRLLPGEQELTAYYRRERYAGGEHLIVSGPEPAPF